MPSRQRVADFIAEVERGRFVEAMQEFYADDATMQENQERPRRGLPVLIERERGVLAAFKRVLTLPVEAFMVEGDRAVIHWIFEFETADGSRIRMDELAWQRWRGDKIVEERFYYDPAQRKPVAQG